MPGEICGDGIFLKQWEQKIRVKVFRGRGFIALRHQKSS